MSTYREKLGLLSEMITFARVDNVIKKEEYSFLLNVAVHLGVAINDFDNLFIEEVKAGIPKSETERIVQFHRLILLMNVDRTQTVSEVHKLHEIGLHMGLPASAINQVLVVMSGYPDNIIPPDVLISIFKASYN